MSSHDVAVLVLEAAIPLDLSIPAHLFGGRYRTPYRVRLCAESRGEVRAAGGFGVRVAGGLDVVDSADTVVVPGFWPHVSPPCRTRATSSS